MKIVFAEAAWEDCQHWQTQDGQMPKRLNILIRECTRAPFTGTGKPEPLKGALKGWWSRRLTLEDRLVYRVTGTAPDQRLEIAMARFHY